MEKVELWKIRKLECCSYVWPILFARRLRCSLLTEKYSDQFIGESAGYKVTPINPLAVKVMKEFGYDIGANPTNRVIDFYNQGRAYDYVITVCNESEEKDCPVFPGSFVKFHWRDFANPENYQGDENQKLAQARALVEAMAKRIDAFVETVR